MAGGAWVRLTVLKANDINKQIKEILGRKADSVTKNPDLRMYMNYMYLEAVTPYVPMRTGNLRHGYVTNDGRIIWSAHHKGYDYADIQYRPEDYETEYINYTTPGTGPHWTDNVQPGTEAWANFIEDVAPEIKRAYKNG